MRGRPKRCRRRCAGAGLGIGPETSGPVGAVAMRARNARAAAQAVWSRRASRAPRGRGGICASGASPPAWTPAQERWVGPVSRQPEKGAGPERSAHRGSCGASLKHRARDADGFGGLAVSLTRQASVSRGTEVRGSSGPRRSARPRIYFPGNGILSPAYGVPGAAQTTRAAERWLFASLAPRLRGEGAERA